MLENSMSIVEHFEHQDCRIQVAINENGLVNATQMCRSSGKRWPDYWRAMDAKAFVGALLEDLNRDTGARKHLGDLVLQDGRGNNTERDTWVHPKIAEHLQQWVARAKRRVAVEGFVYIATSPLLPVIKVGMWTGAECTLWSRYLTYYGPELTIDSILIANPADVETSLHAILNPFALGGELFDKRCYGLARDILQKMQ